MIKITVEREYDEHAPHYGDDRTVAEGITREKLKDAAYVAMLIADITNAVEALER